MRAFLPLLITAAVLAAAVGSASGAANGVTASTSSWQPQTIEIARGETVVWSNPNHGVHNVHFVDPIEFTEPASPGSQWDSVQRTFNEAGDNIYLYYCQQHGSPNGGMRGFVSVDDPGVEGTPTPRPTATASATASPTPGQSATPTTQPTVGSSPTPQPGAGESISVARTRAVFCNTRRCRRPGIRLVVDLDAAGDRPVSGALRRRAPGATRFKRFGRIKLFAATGRHTYRIRRTAAGRLIPAGTYRLRLGADGVGFDTVRFRVR